MLDRPYFHWDLTLSLALNIKIIFPQKGTTASLIYTYFAAKFYAYDYLINSLDTSIFQRKFLKPTLKINKV